MLTAPTQKAGFGFADFQLAKVAVQFSASTFVLKIRHYAKPQIVMAN
jgi:hypothetical protein